MRHRILGRTGLQVSELGFGAWEIGWTPVDAGDQIGHLLNHALDQGINSRSKTRATDPKAQTDKGSDPTKSAPDGHENH